MTVLEGPSGCGKSTLLRMVSGLLPTTGEEIRELGGRSYGRSELPEWRAGVTLLAQDAPVLPGTLEWNLEWPFRLRAADGRAFPRERAAALLEAVGLGGVAADREARSLSGGERHRLALVRGLLWDPPVLLADEPFSGLDRKMAEVCRRLLEAFAARSGHAALVVLHDPIVDRDSVRRIRMTPRGMEVA